MQRTTILSLGGSLIFPDDIDIDFLRNFKETIEKYTKRGHKFVIYCGGGMLARRIQNAASEITKLTNEDLDWLGIHATRLNAQMLRAIFGSSSESLIVDNPNSKIRFNKSIIIAAGWLPGCSTDYDAVLIAKNLGVRQIINMSNIDYVYDKDPRKHKNAKKIEKMRWSEFGKLIGTKWKAGMNAPFDPIASREAKKLNMKVYIIGKDIKNLKKLLNREKFRGTEIS